MTEGTEWNRRTVVSSLGAGVAASLAGCADDVGLGETSPTYDRRTVDADGEGRNQSEMATAERLAEQEIDESVAPRDGLVVTEHEFVLEDGFKGSTVQGVVENRRDSRIETVEVRVRVYNDAGRRLGHYLASTVDLDSGSEWEFLVIVLKSPADVAAYDIAVLGTHDTS